MQEQDIRWQQRFQNFQKALKGLKDSIRLAKDYSTTEKKELLDSIHKGLIKSFELTWELACHVITDYCKYQGNYNIRGSRDAIKEAFHIGLIEDGENWAQMLEARNRSAHVYNEMQAREVIREIQLVYANLFDLFATKMESLKQK